MGEQQNENSNIFIRKDWLDDLGLEVPTTTDELKNVLHEIRGDERY